MLFALLRFFGLVSPCLGQERMDARDPGLAFKTIVAFERLRLSVLELDQAQKFFSDFTAPYTDRASRSS